MMTYADFKSFIAKMVQREGDPDFEGDLDNLIKLGEASIARDLKVQRMEQTQTAVTAVAQTVALPSDFKAMRDVYSPELRTSLSYVPLAEIGRLRGANHIRKVAAYSISNRMLMLAGSVGPGNPLELFLTYKAQIPDFKNTDQSWLTEEREYFDLYVYAVLMHTGPWLKDDERVPMWAMFYQKALDGVIADDAAEKWPDGQLGMLLPEGVA